MFRTWAFLVCFSNQKQSIVVSDKYFQVCQLVSWLFPHKMSFHFCNLHVVYYSMTFDTTSFMIYRKYEPLSFIVREKYKGRNLSFSKALQELQMTQKEWEKVIICPGMWRIMKVSHHKRIKKVFFFFFLAPPNPWWFEGILRCVQAQKSHNLPLQPKAGLVIPQVDLIRLNYPMYSKCKVWLVVFQMHRHSTCCQNCKTILTILMKLPVHALWRQIV